MAKKGELSQKESVLLGVVGGLSLAAAGHVAYRYLRSTASQSDDVSKLAEALKSEIANLNNVAKINALTTPDWEEQQAYRVGGERGMTNTEVETMREIFNSFDKNNNGCVDITALGELHLELGEPLTEDELKSTMNELDVDNVGEVSFRRFLNWWYTKHVTRKPRNRARRRANSISRKNRRGITFKLASSDPLAEEFDMTKLRVKSTGQENTRQHRIQFSYEMENGRLKRISPWHDIPLYHNSPSIYTAASRNHEVFNFVCEIPKWTRRKFEIATGEMFNPIKQDVKHGKLRNYKHGDMMFNYGAFPQTWEDPSHTPDDTKFPGDNDPLDVVEIGSVQIPCGAVVPVRVLGILAMIDSKETDWKVIAIHMEDPLASKMHDIHDVDANLPGAIDAIREYLRIYKCWTGAPANSFALNEECLNRSYALKVIEETHESWTTLRKSGKDVV